MQKLELYRNAKDVSEVLLEQCGPYIVCSPDSTDKLQHALLDTLVTIL